MEDENFLYVEAESPHTLLLLLRLKSYCSLEGIFVVVGEVGTDTIENVLHTPLLEGECKVADDDVSHSLGFASEQKAGVGGTFHTQIGHFSSSCFLEQAQNSSMISCQNGWGEVGGSMVCFDSANHWPAYSLDILSVAIQF
eukprot:CAMPEP_0171476442 /NCGR_PEP_ID=MMETSP0946-20130122/3592_1 /TAXON_ID=109269 /ORGANISM="Vaucheria litorea, Strain CCMP2940" /LENGTH=140 /DNA_ID=CAMNT_0012006703 /DNA_START=188 /DNA_END=610 /DNA_ORIENTATION=+